MVSKLIGLRKHQRHEDSLQQSQQEMEGLSCILTPAASLEQTNGLLKADILMEFGDRLVISKVNRIWATISFEAFRESMKE